MILSNSIFTGAVDMDASCIEIGDRLWHRVCGVDRAEGRGHSVQVGHSGEGWHIPLPHAGNKVMSTT